MKSRHYLIAVTGCSLYCMISLHILVAVLPKMAIVIAAFISYPLIAIVMNWAESEYLTPAVSDFPMLMLCYPLYFAAIFSPLLLLAKKQQAQQVVAPDG